MQNILESGKRLRVAAYCRVSTAKEEQESSYEIQVAFFKEMIAYHPNWEMTEVYADYGITGTSVEKRKGFSRMIEDCKGGKIDLILVKSLSRFARNTLDSLNCIRMLKERNIGVWFDEERINTLDQSGEMLITVLSALWTIVNKVDTIYKEKCRVQLLSAVPSTILLFHLVSSFRENYAVSWHYRILRCIRIQITGVPAENDMFYG